MKKKLSIVILMTAGLAVLLAAFHWKSQHILSGHFQCATRNVVSQQEELLSEYVQQYDSDFFLQKYFIEPAVQKAKANLAQFIRNDPPNCQNGWPAPAMEALNVVYPSYQSHYVTMTNEILQVAHLARDQESFFHQRKSEILQQLQTDLKKYYFFLNQALTTKKTLNLVIDQCRLPASGRVRECQRSASRLKVTLEKEESNLKLNYQILVEKWMPYKEWIDREIALFEKQKS